LEAPVANNIPTFYVQQFSSNIQLKLQQKGSRLRSCVMSGSHVGSQASPVDQFGAIAANKVTSRFAPMVNVDAPTDRRWVFPQDYDLNQLLDTFDMLRLLIDPSSSYVTNAVHALGRAMDQEILTGLLGTNYTGVSGGTSTILPTSTSTGQTVGVLEGAASATNTTVAKLLKARQILHAAEVDPEDPMYCALNAAAEKNLMQETQVISMDYNDKPVLVDGKIVRFLGIDMVRLELLTTGTDDQSGTSTKIPVWVKSGAYLGIWNDIMTKVSQRDDLQSIPYQAYAKGTFGATRLEEKKVVLIWSR
jgi:hypothetical protein